MACNGHAYESNGMKIIRVMFTLLFFTIIGTCMNFKGNRWSLTNSACLCSPGYDDAVALAAYGGAA